MSRSRFDQPFPGLLTYMATSGSYFSTFQPKHFFAKMMPKYNPKANEEAKAAGFEDWTKRFTNYYQKWHDDATVSAAALEVPTLEAYVVSEEPDTRARVFRANPYYFKVDSSGQQLPYFEGVQRAVPERRPADARHPERRDRLQGAGAASCPTSRPRRRTRRRAATTC